MTFNVSDPEHLRDLANNLAEYSAVQVLRVPYGSESAQTRKTSPRDIRSVANVVQAKRTVHVTAREVIVGDRAPSLAVDPEDPTQWEFAAKLVEASGLPGSWSVDQLRWHAEGLRKELAEKAERDNAYTAAALAVLTWVDSTPGVALSGCTPSMLSQIAVDAAFDITPKESNPQ